MVTDRRNQVAYCFGLALFMLFILWKYPTDSSDRSWFHRSGLSIKTDELTRHTLDRIVSLMAMNESVFVTIWNPTKKASATN